MLSLIVTWRQATKKASEHCRAAWRDYLGRPIHVSQNFGMGPFLGPDVADEIYHNPLPRHNAAPSKDAACAHHTLAGAFAGSSCMHAWRIQRMQKSAYSNIER